MYVCLLEHGQIRTVSITWPWPIRSQTHEYSQYECSQTHEYSRKSEPIRVERPLVGTWPK